jgi:hypothetical protein
MPGAVGEGLLEDAIGSDVDFGRQLSTLAFLLQLHVEAGRSSGDQQVG